MPSPLPGMDPYLADPDLWPDLHAELVGDIRAALNPQLRPSYVARIEQRVFISDVRVIVGGPRGNRRSTTAAVGATPGTRSSTATVIEPVDMETQIDDEVRRSFVRVMDVRDRSVVAVIELLSPSNKVPGSAGRRSRQEKRQHVMSSPAH